MSDARAYRFLGTTGVRVSSVCLGCMTFEDGGGVDEPTAHAILDHYVAVGGNFLDVANNYPGAEAVLGRWLAARPGAREQLVIATKARFPVGRRGPNDVGLTRRHLIAAVEDSLRQLGTDYLDLHQAHCWDFVTPLEETLGTYADLIRAGKIRYAGVSNFSGWHLAKAAGVAAARGWWRPVSAQTQYSLLCRSPEWEIVPACLDTGIALTAWSPLAGGWLSGKYHRDRPPPAGSRLARGAPTAEDWEQFQQLRHGASVPHPHRLKDAAHFERLRAVEESQRRWIVIDTLREVAAARGAAPGQVALAWVLARPAVAAVVAGVKSVAQLDENLGAAALTLSAAEIEQLDAVSDPGQPYPHDFYATWGRPWR